MSGHSKWSTIKRQKTAGDIKRGQVFTKVARAIFLAVKEGGGITDPDSNFRLRLAIERAKAVNMPKENIKRAIDRGLGKDEKGFNLEPVLYEGYGPEGVALLIETVTDNKKRTTSSLKHLLGSLGGHLADPGSVSYLFDRQGLIVVFKDELTEDQVFEKALEAGAIDLEIAEDGFEIYTKADSAHQIKEKLVQAGLKIKELEIILRPKSTIPIIKKEKVQKILKLMEMIDDLEEVQKVYANFDIPKAFIF